MTRDQIDSKYRRDYDRLFVASQKANDADECDRINERLAQLNLWRERQLAFLAVEADGLGTPVEWLFGDSEQSHEARVS